MSRGPGRIERRIASDISQRPAGTPLRVLAAMAYATSPGALTASQITGARQVLSRLAGRGEIVAWPGLGGTKLWRTRDAADADARRRDAENEAERGRADERRRQQYSTGAQQRGAGSRRPLPPQGAARQATLTRIAKLIGMLGSAHDGERQAAATALEKLRQTLGGDWVDFLAPQRRR